MPRACLPPAILLKGKEFDALSLDKDRAGQGCRDAGILFKEQSDAVRGGNVQLEQVILHFEVCESCS